MRTVTININRRCPLKCAHCSVGFSDEFAGEDIGMEPESLRAMIAAVDPTVYRMVLLAGGEPTLSPSLIGVGIEACRENGLMSCVVTAPIWARTRRKAVAMIERMSGLDMLILSYDNYHLEFLSLAHYEAAARAAAARGVAVVVQIAFSTEREREELTASLASIAGDVCLINTMRTVSVGNAESLSQATVELLAESDLDRVPRGCVAGNAFLDESTTVHGCCWSSSTASSPLSRAGAADSLAERMDELEDDPLYERLRSDGFLDSLSGAARTALVRELRGRSFACECDVCVAAMELGREHEVWDLVAGAEAARP